MKFPKISNYEAAILGVIGLVLIIAFLGVHNFQFTQPVSCKGTQIGIEYTLKGDQANLLHINECKNGSAGWAGTAFFDIIEPGGNTTRLGGIEASDTSHDKISCGVQDVMSTLYGNIPNAGFGNYEMHVTITPTHGSDIGSQYYYTNTIDIHCVQPSSKCDDGTPLNTCSQNQPKYCSNSAILVNRYSCGCPSGMEWDGAGCSAIETKCTNTCNSGESRTPFPDCSCVKEPQVCENICTPQQQKAFPDCSCYNNSETCTTSCGSQSQHPYPDCSCINTNSNATCGNGVCENGEDSTSCKKDCGNALCEGAFILLAIVGGVVILNKR